jgi:hypothetical protein
MSALSLSTTNLALPAELILDSLGDLTESDLRIEASEVYQFMDSPHWPREKGIGPGVNGIWAWTAGDIVSRSMENGILDIGVRFPVGEAHYMIIQGVKPFTKIQLYNIDYRTDPSFERYNSSGWSYKADEETLIVKMQHREEIEHIKIFYQH